MVEEGAEEVVEVVQLEGVGRELASLKSDEF